MDKKRRSHYSRGASLDAPQKRQKHSASSNDESLLPKSTSTHVGQKILSQLGACPRDTSDLTTVLFSTTRSKDDNHPQLASKSTQAQVQDPRFWGNPLHPEQSDVDCDYAGLGKALNFPILHQSSFGTSTQHHRSSKPSQVSVKFPPYNGRPSTLPPLPPILDKALESVAFTHPGSLNCHSASKVNLTYDRLEFLGDAYIELMATRVIFPRYPRFSAGRLSQHREMLVKNETLAEYALAYSFDEKAKLPNDIGVQAKDSSKRWLKTLGDIFEAFVAAVIISDPEQGFQIAEAWLAALWESKLGSQKCEDTEIVDPGVRQQLHQKIMGRDVRLESREEGRPVEIRREGKLIFQVGIYLTGWGWEDQHLGSGQGPSKKVAGQKAAANAMMNPLTAQVASVKRDFDAQVALERSVQDKAEQEKGKDKGIGVGSDDWYVQPGSLVR